ncbi:MAG: hypothetical protein PHG08_00345 [Bacilli bacterium]|nr:hypothetical protein [Bacilli bacterium]
MSSTILPTLYNYINNSIFEQLLTKNNTLYTFISKTTDFIDNEYTVKRNSVYDYFIRNNIAFAKKVNVSDISYCIERINWEYNSVYDQYDDNYYGANITNLTIIDGGAGYSEDTTKAYVVADSGFGGEISLNIVGGVIENVGILNEGYGYSSIPTIQVIDSSGNNTSDAIIIAEISDKNLSYSGATSLKDCKFYVLTTDYNVYKCLYNNLDSPSTIMPNITTHNVFTTSDGYIWKFMYRIPLGLRRKFLTSTYMPVYNVLSSSYYSDGGIDYIEISNGGSGYSSTTPLKIYVVGDGIGGDFLGKINSTTKEISEVNVLDVGSQYYATTTKLLNNIVRTSGVATLTTDTAHNLVTNTPFTISGTGIIDGEFVVDGIITNKQFTFASIGADISSTNFGIVGFFGIHSTDISSIVRSNNVITVETITNHHLNEGNVIDISGTVGFNGTFTISKYVDQTTFSIYQYGIDDIETNIGTITESTIGISNLIRTSNTVSITTLSNHNFKSPLNIDEINRASYVVTATTHTVNNFVVGDVVFISNTIDCNGEAIITDIIDEYTFKYNDVRSDTIEYAGNVNYYITVSGTTGFDGNYAIIDVTDKNSFKFIKNGSNYNSYIQQKLTYNIALALTSNSSIEGKYDNLTAVLEPNILLRTGRGYTTSPLIYIKGDTGSGATAIANITGDKISSINVVASGSGYITEPDIYFKGGSPNQASATATINGFGVITGFVMNNDGKGYRVAPKVLIVGDGVGATATAVLTGTSITAITLTNGGTGYTTASIYFTGTSDLCCSARAVLYDNELSQVIIDSTIDSISIIDPGVGYDSGLSTTIGIIGDGIGAELTPVIKNGSIISVVVDDSGEGYSYADLTVTGDGVDAELKAVLNVTNITGQSDTLQYNVEVLAVNGSIESIIVTDGGSNYTSALVTITGNGSGALAEATISNGEVTKILITNSGSDYTTAIVTITGDGSGATARAVLPPIGGHGKNALDELFANNIMTYTKISNSDIYNDFTFNNVFFQYGLISNPYQYGNTKVCNSETVSPCITVTGTYILSSFLLNDTLKILVNEDYRYFLIIDRTSTKLLLNSIDNYIPIVGDIIINTSNSVSFTITGVDNPTIDKSSGTIIDINNVISSFYKTPNQTINLRTLISL